MRVDTAAQCAAAVDHDDRDLIVLDAGLEPIDGLEFQKFFQFIHHGRFSAACDISDFVTLVGRPDDERTAESIAAPDNFNRTIVGRFLYPPSHLTLRLTRYSVRPVPCSGESSAVFRRSGP